MLDLNRNEKIKLKFWKVQANEASFFFSNLDFLGLTSTSSQPGFIKIVPRLLYRISGARHEN